MSTFNQIRDGITRAWETLAEGWRELVERAGDALTRFHPKQSGGEIETREDRIARRRAAHSPPIVPFSPGPIRAAAHR